MHVTKNPESLFRYPVPLLSHIAVTFRSRLCCQQPPRAYRLLFHSQSVLLPSSVLQNPCFTHHQLCSFVRQVVRYDWFVLGRAGFPDGAFLLPCPYSYTIERFLVPSSCSSPIGTPDGTPMYQLPDQFPLVHRRAFSSTKRCFELCWYTNRHFPVPNANNYSVGTSICHFAYRSLVLSKKLLEAVLIFAP